MSSMDNKEQSATAVAATVATELPQSETSGQNLASPLNDYPTSWRLAIVITSLCLGTFLMALDVNIIGVAVPTISSQFQSLEDVAWYGSAYLLTVTAFQPIMGFIFKYFRVRMTYLICIFIFEIGSILCAAAPNSPAFIVGRAIAGLGAAGLLQGALGIIGYSVPLEKRPLYMGVVISVFGISICVGPVMGGAFTDHLTWRWCFWINVPIGGVVFILICLFCRLNDTHNEERDLPFKVKAGHMDFVGATLFLAAICCLVLALQWGGQTLPWRSSTVIGLFVGAGFILLMFAFVQWRRGDDALIPLRIFRQRSILMGSIYLLFFGMLNYIYSFYLPFYFQAVQGVSATLSGVRMIPMVLSQIITLILIGAIVTKWGYFIPYMIAGQIICVLGTGLITRIGLDTSTFTWAAFLVVTGIGMGMAMQIPYTAVQIVLSESDIPIGNAILVFTNQFGGTLAIAVGQALLLNGLHREVPRLTTDITADQVIAAGGSGLEALAKSPTALRGLRKAYAISLQGTYIFALAAACAALICVFGMEWKQLKKSPREKDVGLDNANIHKTQDEERPSPNHSLLTSPIVTEEKRQQVIGE